MRPVLVRIQPPQPSFPIANDQVVALRSSVYPWCTSHLTVVSPNSAKADARREGRKLPTIMLLTCPITALSLTTPTVSRDFISYFFCPRAHLPHGTRIASLCHPNSLGPFPLHRFGVAHQTSLRSRSTLMSYAISPEGGGSPNQSDGDSSHHNAVQAFPHRLPPSSVASVHDDRTLGNQSGPAT